MMDFDELPRLNAATFEEPLGKLAEAMAQKVWREGSQQLTPQYVGTDIFTMIRHAMTIYEVLFYLNADVRREGDCDWRARYGVATAPLVRTMIDCLYNITFILEDPRENGAWYRKSGIKKRLLAIEDDSRVYGGNADWDEYLRNCKWALRGLMGSSNLTEDEVRQAKAWQTLGMYLNVKPQDMNANQSFLHRFTFAGWRQYSAMSHAGCEGYIGDLPAIGYFVQDTLPMEQREQIERAYTMFLTRHIGRAALILLCIVTELQLYFRFEGADINARIMKIWMALQPLFEAKELYDGHYSALLKRKGIAPPE